ncbi:MAG: NADH-quinone oxidoreductase subunit J [Duncaniella sp.]|nr:NADH-quinone oxidoreductase subunit J [Duncaniella sp.]MDE6327675.1 NADH-quinone oxidoreductase subunit J [Duncaniella sp.]MDE6358755.1 NADH-quinone oxidoreductase subunit J [Duncaniella sp.]MDE6466433.1 NADH-quinone oxidoreductase subunit J [Duncaniella sp.]MDE6572966.1 NADH-quinone oxidoreductase subunit J [Duncaniella sp.]
MESVGSTICYWIIALAIVIFSVLTVTTRKILRAATYLLFVLFATAALYFKLDYEFLGSVQIAVYAGGIVVLFVFSILLTTRPGDNSEQLESRKKLLGIAGALATAAACGWALCSRCADIFTSAPDMANPTMQEIGTAMLGTGHAQYLLPFEAISVLLLACIIGGVVIARKR